MNDASCLNEGLLLGGGHCLRVDDVIQRQSRWKEDCGECRNAIQPAAR